MERAAGDWRNKRGREVKGAIREEEGTEAGRRDTYMAAENDAREKGLRKSFPRKAWKWLRGGRGRGVDGEVEVLGGGGSGGPGLGGLMGRELGRMG